MSSYKKGEIKLRYSFEREKEKIVKRFIAVHVPREQAEIVADCMVTADLYGVMTHGTAVLNGHLKRIEQGSYNLNPQFKIIRETAAFAVIDGANAIGPVSAHYCMEYAMNKCEELGIFTVFSNNNNTFGPAFYYPLLAARNGLIGIIASNSPAQMTPIGGKEKLLGTNPFAIVIPTGDEPLIIDMATSIVAKSRFKEYKEKGMALPEGWALDIEGKPTVDPEEGLRGFVQPMAGFKGIGLSMIIDILSALSGSAFLDGVGRFYSDSPEGMNVGFYISAINPRKVYGENYYEMIGEYVERMRNSASFAGEKIVLPGDNRISHKNEILGENV